MINTSSTAVLILVVTLRQWGLLVDTQVQVCHQRRYQRRSVYRSSGRLNGIENEISLVDIVSSVLPLALSYLMMNHQWYRVSSCKIIADLAGHGQCLIRTYRTH